MDIAIYNQKLISTLLGTGRFCIHSSILLFFPKKTKPIESLGLETKFKFYCLQARFIK